MFCIVVIISKGIVLKERSEVHHAKKIALSLLHYIWKKDNLKYVSKTREVNKNHVDSSYYAMLLIKFFFVQVHS